MADSEIYMFLLRGSDFFKTDKVPLQFLRPDVFLKNMVRGDSLDVPFVGFMRVKKVAHEISVETPAGYNEKQQRVYETPSLWFDSARSNSHFKSDWTATGSAIAEGARELVNRGTPPAAAPSLRNPYTGTSQPTPGSPYGHLPDHKHLEFTKYLDDASPQLAFGCSAQEKFPMAAFYYRRRVGFGIAGVRQPFMVIGLRRVMIASWKIEGEEETVTLRYEKICWIGTSQLADTNAPMGLSIRYWDRDRNRGGEAGMNWASALGAMTVALVAAAGGIAAALEG